MKSFLNALSLVLPRICTNVQVTVTNKKGYQITFTKTLFGIVINEETHSVKDLV